MNSAPLFGAGQLNAIQVVVAEVCIDMLAACGVPAEKLDSAPHSLIHECHIAGFIGFTGGVRGSLLIAASSVVFQETYPRHTTRDVPPSATDLLDWAGEMTNQTLGRIKRRFCERGIDFEASTPTAVNGRHIGARARPREGTLDLVFAVGDGFVSVCFDVVPPSDGIVFRDKAEPIECSAEGEMVMF
jgi:CheY-specific phosphatase CheX